MMPISRVGVKRSGGFSLLEALIVIVLVGLLAVIVSPSLSSVYRGVVLKSTVRSIAGTLRYVRASAIGASQPMVFSVDFEDRIFTVRQPTVRSNNNRGAPQTIANYIELADAEEAQVSSAAKKPSLAIKFFPNGGSTGGRLMLAYKHSRYSIDVNPFTGKVSVNIPADTTHKIKTPAIAK